MNTSTVKHMLKGLNGKRLSSVYVRGKGWFGWNTAFHVYNSHNNYEQLQTADLPNVDYYRRAPGSPVFDDPLNPSPDIIKMQHGRKGEDTEYVEYRPYNSRVAFAAQRSGNHFFVFEIHPGKNGAVNTVGQSTDPNEAAQMAFSAALKVAEA